MADESAILLTISLAYLFSSYLKTMKDQANSGITEKPGTGVDGHVCRLPGGYQKGYSV